GLNPRGFSGLPLSNLRGARTTTWLWARILIGIDPLHDVRHVTAWSQGSRDADRAEVRAPHDIAGRLISTAAPIGSAMLRPLSAYGARLRSVRFLDLNRGGQLVAKQVDQL